MKVFHRRLQVWLTLFCVLTAFVGLFIFIGSTRAEGEAVDASVQESGMEMQMLTALQPNGVVNPNCLDNYENWPSSQHKKNNANWDLDFLIPTQPNLELNQFMDVNGDGLLDYLYILNSQSVSEYKYSSGMGSYSYTRYFVDGVEIQDQKWHSQQACVYLNNGSGWDLAYRCMMKNELIRSEWVGNTAYTDYEPMFYGDCADTSQ